MSGRDYRRSLRINFPSLMSLRYILTLPLIWNLGLSTTETVNTEFPCSLRSHRVLESNKMMYSPYENWTYQNTLNLLRILTDRVSPSCQIPLRRFNYTTTGGVKPIIVVCRARTKRYFTSVDSFRQYSDLRVHDTLKPIQWSGETQNWRDTLLPCPDRPKIKTREDLKT